MCGIGGIFFRRAGNRVDGKILSTMGTALQHRGPDDQGVYLAPDALMGLAFRRLAITDLDGGNQPLSDHSGDIRLVANGEIFNYRELSLDLSRRGHLFRTSVDVEVIIHLYREYGLDLVGHLRGQFAFALWDAKCRRLVLARDRLGIQPLFYHLTAERVVFASEMKALFAAGVPREPDERGIVHLFALGSPQAPRTCFKGIESLKPGHVMIVSEEQQRSFRYWDISFPEKSSHDESRTTESWAEELRERLGEATRLQIRASDVEVGAYLSGGIDSSCVLALASGIGTSPIPTFTLSFDDDEHDESVYAALVAARLGVPQTTRQVTYADVARELPRLVWRSETGFLTTEAISLMMLAGTAAGRLKVALTGEGADEIFGGYIAYRLQKILLATEHDRTGLARRLLRCRLSAEEQQALWPSDHERHDIIDRFGFIPASVCLQRLICHDRHKILSPELADGPGGYNPFDDLSIPRQAVEGRHPLDQSLYFSIHTSLPNYILASHGDRAAMTHSLELRYPFLDHKFVEFTAKLPPRLKMRGFTEKFILRRAFNGMLPNPIVRRRKKPLTTPIARALFAKDRPDYVDDLLSRESIEKRGYFAFETVDRLRAEIDGNSERPQRRRQALMQHRLLAVLTVQLWDEMYIRNWTSEPPVY